MQLDFRITGTTKLTGLIGNPVEHTVSPTLHNTLFHEMGLDGVYLPLKVPEGGLGDAVKGLKASGYTGFNVTIPYKEEILQYIDEVSEEVILFGAANTVKISDGKLYGFNTDADGFMNDFKNQAKASFKGSHVCILGAGGTAKTLAVKIALEGAAEVDIINRSLQNAMELAATINKTMEKAGRSEKTAFAFPAGKEEASQKLSDCDIMINTTSVGMYPDIENSPVQKDFIFKSRQMVYDVIYNPSQTKLLERAEECGCKTFNGAGMLFYQGLKAFEIWMDTTVPEKIFANLLKEFLKYLKGYR